MNDRCFWLKVIGALAIVAILAAIILPIIGTSCTGDTDTETDHVYNYGTNIANFYDNFKTIDDSKCLSYDTNTYVIYYIFKLSDYGYMSPYISENGHFCRYIDGEIIEITEG